MDVNEALKRRRTTRAFEPDGLMLQREFIEELIAKACMAPSEFDLQPWRFLVVRDRERKEMLYQCAFRQSLIRDASAAIIVCGDTRGHEAANRTVKDWIALGLIDQKDALRVETSIKAAYEASEKARLIMAIRNASYVAMNLMLLATEQGIATTPIVSFSEEAIRRAFKIPERYLPVVLVLLGLPSTTSPQPPECPRVPVSQLVFHEEMEP